MSKSSLIKIGVGVLVVGVLILYAQSLASHVVSGPTLPARCSPTTGDIFFRTSTPVGLYTCGPANVWNLANVGSTTLSSPVLMNCPNDPSVGTVNNQLVKLSSAGNCLNAQIGDFTVNSTLSSIVGIVVSGGGAGGTSQVAIGGVANCLFDNAVTIADWVSGSPNNGGQCNDTGIGNTAWSNQGGSIVGFAVDGGAAGIHKVFVQKQTGGFGSTLWFNRTRLETAGFNGQLLLRQSSGAAGTGLQLGSSTTSPCLKDNGALLQIVGATTGCTGGDADLSARLFAQQVQASIACAGTIAPTGPVFHVTTTACAIATITAPTIFATSGYGGCITIIPDVAFTTTTAGNIAVVISTVLNQAINLCYDNATSKWYPASSSGMMLISTNTLGSAASSVTFSSIPATFKDLILTIQGRGDTAAARVTVNLQFNGDTGANYEWVTTDNHGGTITGAQGTGATSMSVGVLDAASNTASYAGEIDLRIINYTKTTFFKDAHSLGALRYDTTPNAGLESFGGTWASTAAVNQIVLLAAAGNFVTGSTFTLYGIQ